MAEPTATRIRFVVPSEQNGERLDRILAANVVGLSRSRARVLLDLGGVFVDRVRVKMAGRPLRAGQQVEAYIGGALSRASAGVGRAARDRDDAALPAPRIVYVDDDLVIIDKPAALISAPTPESDRGNARALLAAQLGEPVHVVHRLDLGTSGLLIYARTADANRALAETFRRHDLLREYEALLLGAADWSERVVNQPIEGRAARTHLRRIETLRLHAADTPGSPAIFVTRVRCRLETGRTHQIRLHARSLGCPVLGDRLHGVRTPALLPQPPRMCLHAARLSLRHPRTGAALDFDCPLPVDLAQYLDGLRRMAGASDDAGTRLAIPETASAGP
jgi:23S rRNA pseudouridine1911/1915/1917 synthase